MQVDIQFEFARVFNFEKADIVKGQKFTIINDTDGMRYFSDNDPVLSYKVNGKVVDASADEAGLTTVLIMDAAFAIQKTLTINVVDTLQEKAATLNPVAGPAEPK